MSGAEAPATERKLAARLGIVALNLFAPGLGLLRLGRARQAAVFYFVPFALFLLVLLIWSATDVLPFWALLLTAGPLAAVALAALLGSAWLSWRDSAGPSAAPRPPWARWPAIAAAWILSVLVANGLVAAAHDLYRPFYMPSQGMAPTLMKDDRIVASMRVPNRLRRGDIILVRTANGIHAKRLAGLPGDLIGMRDGHVLINGGEASQRLVRQEDYRSFTGARNVRRLEERFPGEAAPHEIYDEGESAQDNYPPVRVRPGHLFLLGDNRDMSADSRFGPTEGGVGQVLLSDVAGIALYYTYGPSGRSRQRVGPAR